MSDVKQKMIRLSPGTWGRGGQGLRTEKGMK